MDNTNKNYIINNLQALVSSGKTKEEIKSFLSGVNNEFFNMLITSYEEDEKEKKASKHFLCPRLNLEVTKNCHIESCEYHVNWPLSNNCLLGYLKNTENREQLNFSEISYLLNIKYKKVLKIYNTALSKVQKNPEMFLSLRNDNSQLKYKKKYEFVQTDKVCCVCESRIPKVKSHLKIQKIGLAYCSTECKEEKSTTDMIIEYKQGIDSEEYLKIIQSIYNKSTIKKVLAYIKRTKKDDH